MKKMFVVLAVLVSVVFSAFPVFGDIQTQIPEKKLSVAEEIKMLGFPENIAASFAQIIEQEKKAKPTEPIANGIVVPVAISKGQLCSSGCRFSWPETVGYNPMAKKYTVETYVLYHWKNKGIDIFYRDQLPKLEAKVATLNILPEMKKPAATATATEQQVVVPVTPVTTIPASYTPKTSPSEKRENVEKPVEAYALSLDMSKMGKVVATAVEFPILRTRWINDGIGKYFVFESKEGEAVQKFMSRSSWRSIVSDSSGNYEIFPAVKRRCDVMHLIVIGKSKSELTGKYKYLVSSNGKKALLANGMQVEFDFEKFQEDESYKIDFLRKYPSPIESANLLDISPGSKYGDEYVLRLKEQFPKDFYVKGERVSFNSDLPILRKLNGELSGAKYGHRVIKNGGLPVISVSSILFFPFEIARVGIVLLLSAREEPLNGSYESGMFSGNEIGDTIDECVTGFLADYQRHKEEL